MKYIEKYILLKYFYSLDADYISYLSKACNQTVNGYKNTLHQDVYFLPKLSLSQKKWLLCKLPNMDEDEIAIIEKTNHLSINKIIKILESEVFNHEKN